MLSRAEAYQKCMESGIPDGIVDLLTEMVQNRMMPNSFESSLKKTVELIYAMSGNPETTIKVALVNWFELGVQVGQRMYADELDVLLTR